MSECGCASLRDCTDVVLDLYAAIDAGRARSAMALFADEPVFETTRQRAEGRDAVSAFLAAREDDTARRTLHVLTNLRHDSAGATARLDALLLVYGPGPDGQPWVLEHAGPARHELVQTDDGWLIAQRAPG